MTLTLLIEILDAVTKLDKLFWNQKSHRDITNTG